MAQGGSLDGTCYVNVAEGCDCRHPRRVMGYRQDTWTFASLRMTPELDVRAVGSRRYVCEERPSAARRSSGVFTFKKFFSEKPAAWSSESSTTRRGTFANVASILYFPSLRECSAAETKARR